jgi:alanyl-tRNA synthetase
VHPDYLRFDFAHFQQVTLSELRKIERIVNERIWQNAPVSVSEESLETAIAGGAKAFFDEKYGDRVRVLTVGKFSKELCGGTHAERLGEAGLFRITSESSVASGVRRMIAVTGEKAYQSVLEQEDRLLEISGLLKSSEREVVTKVEKLIKEKSDLQKKLSQQSQSVHKSADDLLTEIENVRVIIDCVQSENAKELRPLADRYKQMVQKGVVMIGAVIDQKVTLLVSVTDDLASDFQMNKFVEVISKTFDGKGGGKPQFAQVGGSNVSALSKETMHKLLKQHLQSLKLTT